MFLSFSNDSDKAKFHILYTKYKKLLMYKAYEILDDYSLAEDAASEAYIRIYKNISKIDDPLSNKAVAFIVTIVKNVALTIRSKQSKIAIAQEDESTADGFDLESHVEGKNNAEQIYAIIDTLSEDLKSVFMLKFAYDLSHREIGKILGISENNVGVKLYRARKKLMSMISTEEEALL